jgi:hypothetical protein
VSLGHEAAAGYAFQQFTGDCAPDGVTTMTAARTCSATFVRAAAEAPLPPIVGPPRPSRRPVATVDTPASAPGGASAPSGASTPAVQASPSSAASTTASPGSADPVTTTPTAKPTITADEFARSEILRIVNGYCAAYDSMQPAKIKQLYPQADLHDLSRQFREYKSLKCTVTSPPEYDLLNSGPNGAAQIRFGMKQAMVFKVGGQPDAQETIVSMHLSRGPFQSDWTIDSAKHAAKPKP